MAKTIIKVIKNVKITFPLVAFAISAMAKQNAKIAGRSINKKRYNSYFPLHHHYTMPEQFLS